MSTLNKFIIYQCDTCARQTEILIDGKRPDPVHCNITLKCRGKLQRVGESSIKKFLLTPPVEGLQDYVPRGTLTVGAPNVTAEPQVNLSSGGGSGILSMALFTRTVNGATHSFNVVDVAHDNVTLDTEGNAVSLPQNAWATLSIYPISQELLASKQYSYLVTNEVQSIQGADSQGNNLKFSSTNLVRVFVNGVELSPAAFTAASNVVTFTPAIYESNNVVDVFVFNNISNDNAASLLELKFYPLDPNVPADLAFLNSCAWGDTQAIKVAGGVERYLLFCDYLGALQPDFSYGIANLTASSLSQTVEVLPSEAYLLLAQTPFSVIDKELYAYLGGEQLLAATTYLSYVQDQTTGEYNLTVQQSSLTQLASPLVPSVKVSPAALTQSNAGAVAVPNPVTLKYILGPT